MSTGVSMRFPLPPAVAEPPPELPLEPLLSACLRLDVRHLSLFGSARRLPLRLVSDVDVHLVIPHLDQAVFRLITTAAEATAGQLAAAVGRQGRLELRHGPFKPPPARTRELQLHLLIDDDASLLQSTCALVTQRAASGVLLAGESLLCRRPGWPCAAVWLREAQAELARWRGALATREITFRYWSAGRDLHLVEDRTPAASAWDLMCLLNGAAKSSDLHYRAAALAASEVAPETLAQPLLSQLDVPDFPALPERWSQLCDQAMAVLDRRLEHLRCMLCA
jgi:hypothetical protein